MRNSWPRTRLAARLGIEYPLIQGPLGGLSSQRLAAAVSNFGGLGSFGAHTRPPEAIPDLVDELRSMTSRPFAVNLWVSMEDPGAREAGPADFARSLGPIAPHLAELGIATPDHAPYQPQSFEQQAEALIRSGAPVFSFIFGVPSWEILDECRTRKIITIGTATTVDEAIALEEAGVDAIAASGFEGGGHRGSFLDRAEESLIGTMALVPQVVDAVTVPVIAAGGIGDARGVVAALALGAEGVQMGTAFLASDDSGASEVHRRALRSAEAQHTGLTRGFTGRLARGIHNRLMEELNRPGAPYLPYPLQRALIRNLAVPADAAGRTDLLPLWAGQAARLPTNPDAADFLRQLVAEVGAIAGPVTHWSTARRSAR
ncbi:MAG TPA: nitronate monooxygenase [Gemmatimonadales bacterium]|nr:nitronate monooxygenase [Gemmatimonadales bacterium]